MGYPRAGVEHAERPAVPLVASRRERRVEPKVPSIVGHARVDEVKRELLWRHALVEQVTRDATSRIGPGRERPRFVYRLHWFLLALRIIRSRKDPRSTPQHARW